MSQQGPPKFDLEERTYEFAQAVRAFVKKLPRTICNLEDVKQLVCSSGSLGANYIEANERLSKKWPLLGDGQLLKPAEHCAL